MDDDWVTNFFDKSRIVSDSDMQELWARVLAGEANSPGTYSKRTVNFLGDLDKRDAELLSALCSFGWFCRQLHPACYSTPKHQSTMTKVINFSTLTHLDSIGLVQFNNISGFIRRHLPRTFIVAYCGQPLTLTMQNEKDNDLPIGRVLLTQVGLELASVCQAPGVEGFVDYVKKEWNSYLPEEKNAEPDGPPDRQETAPASR